MPTLHVPPWFPEYLAKLEKLDRPSLGVIAQKLIQIIRDPFGGITLSDLAQIPAPGFSELADRTRGLFDPCFPGLLSGIPETAIWCAFDEVLIEGRTPPPTPTRAMVIYVPRGAPPAGVNLEELFPAAARNDVAAIIIAPVWMRSEWLLIDPFGP